MNLLTSKTEHHRIDKYNRSPALVRSAPAVIDSALSQYPQLAGIWSLFSGGHDSLVTTHVISQHPAFLGVIHIDTGTGVPETEQFVRATCERFGWRLIVKQPVTSYEQLIVRYGFPGPAQHNMMYRYLKERPLRQAKLEAQAICGGKIAYGTGVRSQESERRMGHVEPIRHDKMGYWIAPLHDWTAHDLGVYMRLHALPANRVKRDTHMSGECLCSAFSKRGEKQMFRLFYPRVAERIERWEALVRAARDVQVWEAENGFRSWDTVIPEERTKWGWSTAVHPDQMEMFGWDLSPGPLCWACQGD